MERKTFLQTLGAFFLAPFVVVKVAEEIKETSSTIPIQEPNNATGKSRFDLIPPEAHNATGHIPIGTIHYFPIDKVDGLSEKYIRAEARIMTQYGWMPIFKY